MATNHTEPRMIPTSDIRPNDYNPNRMSEEEFAELVGEVKHLGRLPKPVVLRQNAEGYLIVDGEHNWRAAREAGLESIPCEVVDVDDFEAMRQTYKRNQHGTHNFVLLGRMFQRMMKDRDLSGRALAKEIEVSEGSIRNALLFAEAAEVRNRYAAERETEKDTDDEIAGLSVREARLYVDIGPQVGNLWLDSGGNVKALERASEHTVRGCFSRKRHKVRYEPEDFRRLGEVGLYRAIEPGRFVESCQRAWGLDDWLRRYVRTIKDAVDYAVIVAERRKLWGWDFSSPEMLLDELPLPRRPKPYVPWNPPHLVTPLLTPPQWKEALERAEAYGETWNDFHNGLKMGVEVVLRRSGINPVEDVMDPKTALAQLNVEQAPDFIRCAQIPLEEKTFLACYENEDVPAEQLLAFKRLVCEKAEAREAIMRGEGAAAGLAPEARATLEADVMGDTAQNLLPEMCQSWIENLFDDPDRVMFEALQAVQRRCAGRTIGGRPAGDVLQDRMNMLPKPERVALASFIVAAHYRVLALLGKWVPRDA